MELWKSVPSHPGYEASSEGRVRSVDRTLETVRGPWRVRGILLKPLVNHRRAGYMYVSLPTQQPDARAQRLTVHLIIAETFLGPRPAGLEVRHLNGNNQDNRASNLTYGTRSQNAHDRVRHGTNQFANRECCPRTHELAAPNLVASSPGRNCLACHRAGAYLRRHPGLDMQTVSDLYFKAITSSFRPRDPRLARASHGQSRGKGYPCRVCG